MNVTASAEGSLFELVCRGNKDTFFFKDSNESKCIFDNSYVPQGQTTSEIRRVPPRSTVDFGRTVEFDIDRVGDLLRDPAILIHLPTWLPPTIAQLAHKSVITDTSGVSYGYTNGIAYFLFESIQLFQETILLQEFSGDSLWAMSQIEGTYANKFIVSSLTGQHDGSPLSIARNAAPPVLRLDLPLIGCQQGDAGFPMRSLESHTYRLRCKLRRLEDIIEASDGRYKPSPWNRSDFQGITAKGAAPTPFTTLERPAPLQVFFETRQVYITRDAQTTMKQTPIQVPFKRIYENKFTQNQLDYAGVSSGGISYITRRLDACHPSGRMLWFFRSIADINANQLWKVTNSASASAAASPAAAAAAAAAKSYYNTLTFLIAGKTREDPRDSVVWRDIVNFAKEDIDSATQINTMNWSLGCIAPKRFPIALNSPTGTVNFSTADRPTLYIQLAAAPIDPLTGAPNTELRVFVESWGVYQTDGKGRGEMMSAN